MANMKHILSFLLCLAALTAHSLSASGQGVSSLGKASEIASGTFPNGMRYYIVSNPDTKGTADFALIQKGAPDPALARRCLSSLPHFGGRKPYEFLADRGISCPEGGYVSYERESTRFDFKDVPMYNSAAADSTLMMLFDIASTRSVPQAVVVSGDLERDKIRERMGLLSMMVPTLGEYVESPYIWNPREDLAMYVSLNESADAASIRVLYSTERLPREALDTPQSLLTALYAYQLGQVVKSRAVKGFAAAGIPLGGVDFRYKNSEEDSSDERYLFTINTSYARIWDATKVLAGIFSDLDSNGAQLEEFQAAKDAVLAACRIAVNQPRSNKAYVDQCVSSWLYGSTLASLSARVEFVTRSTVADERDLMLFNSFVKALLDPCRNLMVGYDVPRPGLDRHTLHKRFSAAWDGGATSPSQGPAPEIPKFQTDSRRRVKLRSDKPEVISGGKMWTFSNGARVIFKKTDADKGEFHYALMMPGGYTYVPGYKPGQGAFISDMPQLLGVAGLSPSEFRRALAAEKLTMDTRISLTELSVSGKGRSSSLPFLLNALLQFTSSCSISDADFETYKANKIARIKAEELASVPVNALMDSLMRPSYHDADRAVASRLPAKLHKSFEAYLESQFRRAADGILVFVGDLDEDQLKKELAHVLGEFSSSERSLTRPRIQAPQISGTSGATLRLPESPTALSRQSVNLAVSALVPYTNENRYAFQYVTELVRRELIKQLAPLGVSVEVSGNIELFPSERMTLFVNCRPCRGDALPQGVAPADQGEVLAAARRCLSGLSSLSVGSAGLKSFREALLVSEEISRRQNEAVIADVLIRYSLGKDMVTGYQAAIKGLGAENVKYILARLQNGAKAEYTIE